jgi:prepilin-type N-terminal cleavage/methylation domain-containing protein
MRNGDGQRGFTMIELVAVLVIMAVVTAVAVERLFTQDTAQLGAIAATVRNNLRYARTRSMNSDVVFGVQIISTTTYAVFRNGNTGDRVVLPGEVNNGVITLEAGATFTLGVGDTIAFDKWGRPCSNAAGTTLRTADASITVSYLGQTENIVVVRNTGFLR